MLGFKTFEWDNSMVFEDIETIEGPPYRRYKIGDKLYPSMTSILKVLEKDGDGLDQWRKRVGDEEADRIVKEAVERGNNLHYLSELYLMNKLTRPEIKGPGSVMFRRSKQHLDKLQTIMGIEVPVYSHQFEFAGRMDLLAIDEDGDFCVCDHKNSRKPIDTSKDYGRKKLFKYMLQCCGYSICLEEMFGRRPTHGKLFIATHSTMDTKVHKFPLKPLDKSFKNLVESFYGRADVNENQYFRL